jgi:hypothetical protein
MLLWDTLRTARSVFYKSSNLRSRSSVNCNGSLKLVPNRSSKGVKEPSEGSMEASNGVEKGIRDPEFCVGRMWQLSWFALTSLVLLFAVRDWVVHILLDAALRNFVS